MGELRTANRERSDVLQSSRERHVHGLMLALVAVLLAGGMTFGETNRGWAQGISQTGSPFPNMSTFQSGRITGVSGNSVQIDGKGYDLRPDVEIKKPDGMVLLVQDLRKGALAQFHLKQGRIDMLVLFLPD